MASADIRQKLRCAIYTRKSHEEGLEQEYNSLDAQHDAALALIASQKHEGWSAVHDRYDDGGYSGGNMERPALQRLLHDIADRKIDVVVVYKIDRLSRSLVNFANMIELFDKHGVTFISVTQQFNTTSSMGRLTLNILLSFAQFEREVTSERIRDKFAASKKKGLWMGGVPPLGYDVRERKLVVNVEEAELIQHIFTRFTQLGSPVSLAKELAQEGYTTKAWVTQKGRVRMGRPISATALHHLLRNRLYLGEINHKNQSYPGEHAPLISQELWQRVQKIFEWRRPGTRRANPDHPHALLAGLLYTSEGHRMLPTYTRKPSGKLYRYYFPSINKLQGAGASSSGNMPAIEIEAVVMEQVKEALSTAAIRVGVLEAVKAINASLPAGDQDPLDEATVVVALNRLGDVWESLFPAEQQRIVHLLIERVQLQKTGVLIAWHQESWQQIAQELVAPHPLIIETQQLEGPFPFNGGCA